MIQGLMQIVRELVHAGQRCLRVLRLPTRGNWLDAQAEHVLHGRVFADSPDFISYCRIDGGYIDVNPAFESFVGLPREQIIGRTPMDIGLWASPQERADFIGELRLRRSLLGYHKRLLRFNGEVRDIEGWARIVDLAGEEVLVAIGRDATQRRAQDAELAQYRNSLEQLVGQRTQELRLTNEQLQIANTAKSSFLANMSHELRTPLNAVLGYAQILRMDGDLNPRQLAGVNTIEQSGQLLLALINDIFDLARVEAGKLVLHAGPANLRVLLDSVVDIVRMRAVEKSLEFRFDPAPGLPLSVVVDEQRVRQVLLNLLGNAVKFTDAGHVTMRVAAQRHGDRSRVRFEVSDTGVGMTAEDLARLFLPFEQVGDVRRRSAGAGLGLSISQALAHLMGGEIAVESMPGRGSTFRLELELPVVETHPHAASPCRRVTGYVGPRKHLLVVDDVAANRKLLVDLLQPLGFRVTEADDGHGAIAATQVSKPDLILMDMMMPGMDGLEATRRLRQGLLATRLPIVAVSANASNRGIQDCLSAGADAYLTKPIVTSQLLECIRTQLDLTYLWKAGAGMATVTAQP
jgi:PAS domain S-box-containing protein